jgi:hypothetical protein
MFSGGWVPAADQPNGTIAIGTAPSTPWVISMVSAHRQSAGKQPQQVTIIFSPA